MRGRWGDSSVVVTVKAEQRAEPAAEAGIDMQALAREQLPRVERLLLRILGPRPDMEDLVQTVFVELCQSLHRHRGDARLSTFVGGITVNVARRAMRPRAWWRRRGPMPEHVSAHAADPEACASAREQMRCVREALEGLTTKKRVAFSLWAFDGMPVEEIAAITGASVSATWSRIYYAQKELRAQARRDAALREALGGTS